MRTPISHTDVRRALREVANPAKAAILKQFFKTGKGEYGEGDQFLGITVPVQRRIAKRYQDLPITDVVRLLHSRIHEERLTALLMLSEQYLHGTPEIQAKIYQSYLSNTAWINNWDLVDATAPHIIGHHLFTRPRSILKRLSVSLSVWERRIAIISTFAFIRQGQFTDTLTLSKQLLKDPHDLIHKAVGWMLREIGKRDRSVLDRFLDENAEDMPRTMLRYAIEKYPHRQRLRLLSHAKRVAKNP